MSIVRSPVRSVVRSPVRGVFGGSASLLDEATSALGGVAPYHFLDFITNRALYASVDVGNVTQATGYTFTRASVGSYRNADGTTTQFSSGQLRRGDRGVLIEGARTNLFLNSATGATQSVTVAAAAHTLSFEGTGTVTLSGVSTAGPLVGTGALNRVSLTFTPTAGSLTLTITGTVERVNLEAGAFASSWIPTAGSSVARSADVLTYTAGVTYPLGLWAEFERAVDTGEQEIILQTDTGANAQRAIINVAVNDAARAQMLGGANSGSATTGSIAVGAISKVAGRILLNDCNVAINGTAGTADTTADYPTNPTLLRIGTSVGGVISLFGYIRRIAAFNFAPIDAQLQSMTS
jgi:hypothetical protein